MFIPRATLSLTEVSDNRLNTPPDTGGILKVKTPLDEVVDEPAAWLTDSGDIVTTEAALPTSIARSDVANAGRLFARTLTMVPPVDGPSLGKKDTMVGSLTLAKLTQYWGSHVLLVGTRVCSRCLSTIFPSASQNLWYLQGVN